MRAGSPAQEKFLQDKGIIKIIYPESYYTVALELLKEAGLQPDTSFLVADKEEMGSGLIPYSYGSKWLFEEIAQEVLDFLESLPETKLRPAWC